MEDISNFNYIYHGDWRTLLTIKNWCGFTLDNNFKFCIKQKENPITEH